MRTGQRADLTLLLAWSFSVVAAIFIGRTVRDTLFLSNEGAARLPIMYIVSPVTTTLVGLGYGKIVDRINARLLAPATALTIAALLVLARFGLGPHWLYYVLYAGLDVGAVLLTMQFWLAAGERFSTREAKRIFTIIAASGTAATVVTGLVLSAIVSHTGAANLLFGCAAFQVVVAVLAIVLGRRPLPPTQVVHRRVDRGTGPVPGTRHLDLLVPLVMVAIVSVTLIDFQFKSVVNATFASDRAGMVRFFGLLYVGTAATALVIQLALTRRILARFGVAGALLLLPLTLGLGAVALLIVPSLITATASKAADATFRNSVDSAGQQLLYLPAPPGERSRRKRRIDMLIKPATEGSVGVALLAYKTFVGARTPLAVIAVIAIAVWLVLVLRMRRAYVRSVAETLRRRRIPEPDEAVDTALAAEAVRVVRDALADPDPAMIRRGLDLARLDPATVRDELHALSSHADPGVRADAIGCLGTLGDPELTAALADASIDVRAAAARCANEHQLGLVEPLLDGEPAVSAAAAHAICARGDDARRDQVRDRVRRWLATGDRVQRRLALAVAEDARFTELLVAIATDTADDTLAAASLRAVGRIADPDAVDRLLPFLTHKQEVRRGAAAAALARLRRAHPDRVPPVAPIVAACTAEITRGFIAMAAAAGLGHAESVMKPDGTRVEVPYIPDNLAGPAALLSRALRERTERARDRVLDLLAALEPALDIPMVRANLRDPDPARRANAIELLDATPWPASVAGLKSLALAIVDDASRDAKLAAAGKKIQLPRYDRNGWIDTLLADRNPWIRACTAYYAGAARDRGARPRIAKLVTDSNLLVAETAQHALRSIDTTPETTKMLTTAEKVLFLKGAELFAAMPAEDVAAIAQVAEQVSYEQGDVIFSAGDPGDSLYLVVEGTVRIAAGEKTLAELGTREVFGEMAILDPAPRSATATALAPLVVVRLAADDFADVLAERPEVASGIVRVLVRRLRSANAA